jgi:hypothetical protein
MGSGNYMSLAEAVQAAKRAESLEEEEKGQRLNFKESVNAVEPTQTYKVRPISKAVSSVKERKPLICFRCRESGHIASECDRGENKSTKWSNKQFSSQNPKHISQESVMLAASQNNWKMQLQMTQERPQLQNQQQPPIAQQQLQMQQKYRQNLCSNQVHYQYSYAAQQQKQQRPNNSADGQCFECNEYGHLARACPMRRQRLSNYQCRNCGNLGHTERHCYPEN